MQSQGMSFITTLPAPIMLSVPKPLELVVGEYLIFFVEKSMLNDICNVFIRLIFLYRCSATV